MDISIDTRTIKPGQTFIPIKGAQFDGHDYIPEAIKKGAHILDVDIEKFAKKYRKKLTCPIIAITGSAGKTTVKDLLFSIFSPTKNTVKTLENQNNEIGVPLSLLRAEFDTDIAILECAMRNKGEIQRSAKVIRPTHVVITGIGYTHLENLKTQKNIAKAKAEIFLPAQSWETAPRYAYINATTPFYDLLVEKATKAGYKVLPYGGSDKPEQNVNVCYLIGRHFGLSDDQIRDGLSHYKSSSHRLHVIKHNGYTVIDDTYNSNPDGVQYAFQFLQRYKGRKIAVLGDMLELGAATKKCHKALAGWAIENQVDMMFTYGDLIKETTSKKLPIYHFSSKEALLDQLQAELKTNDIVLVKGSRGLKMETIVQALTTP